MYVQVHNEISQTINADVFPTYIFNEESAFSICSDTSLTLGWYNRNTVFKRIISPIRNNVLSNISRKNETMCTGHLN